VGWPQDRFERPRRAVMVADAVRTSLQTDPALDSTCWPGSPWPSPTVRLHAVPRLPSSTTRGDSPLPSRTASPRDVSRHGRVRRGGLPPPWTEHEVRRYLTCGILAFGFARALQRLRPASTRVPVSSADARLICRLPRPAYDGRTRVRLSPLELIDRLARLAPPPRVHRPRYHGVFAPNAKWRREATRYGREDEEDAGSDSPDGSTSVSCSHATDRGARRRWAQLLARVCEVHPLRCPACHGEMRILAFLTDPAVVRPILRHLRIPEHPPPISAARGPPQTELLAVDPPSPWDRASHGTDPARWVNMRFKRCTDWFG